MVRTTGRETGRRRFLAVGCGAWRGSDLATKLAVQSTPAQRRWVDEEAQRRGIPKSAVVRDVVAAEIGNPPVDARVVAYAKASNPAAALRARGGTFRAAAEQFRGDDHTAAMAVRWFRDR